MKRAILATAFVLLATAALADDGTLNIVTLGDFKLDNGAVIRDCKIGYRTYGQRNADSSNVIVVTTWFRGTSAGFAGSWIKSQGLFDPSKYHVIVIDAFGDGVSSSPSNSTAQPGAEFPQFTIRDLVRSQHQLLTGELGLKHVFAVTGLSMGGMQALQWAVSYPDYMDRILSVVGTPKLTAYDILLWRTELNLLERLRDVPDRGVKSMKTLALIQELEIVTPAYINSRYTAETVDKLISSREESLLKHDPEDYAAQLRAMIGHDIYRDFDGSIEKAVAAIKVKMMIVVSMQDHMVNPTPARDLARVAKAEILTLTGDCGHLASGCEQDLMIREVQRFFGR